MRKNKYLLLCFYFCLGISCTYCFQASNVNLVQGRDTMVTVVIPKGEYLRLVTEKNKAAFPIVSVPNPTQVIAPKELNVIDAQNQEMLFKHFDSQLKFFSILISIILTVLGIGIGFLQFVLAKEKKKELQKEFNLLKKETDFETKFENLRKEIFNRVPIDVSVNVKKEFKEKYEQEIFDNTKRIAYEAMMLEPSVKGLTLSRLRRTQKEFYALVKELSNEKVAKRVGDIWGRSVEDWHTLSQLFSLDEIELQKGLLSFKSMPFPEAKSRINFLKVRYENSPTLLPHILDAIKSLEKRQ